MSTQELTLATFTQFFLRITSTPVGLSDSAAYNSISEPATAGDVELRGYWNYLDRLFKVPTYNPQQPKKLALIQSLYIQSIKKQGTVDTDLPSSSGFAQFHALVKNSRIQTIIVKGRRGSGKTNAINYYLSRYFNELCSNSIPCTFFRADIAKLYAANSKITDPSRLVGVRDYMEAHAYYVVLKYAKSNSDDKLMSLFSSELDRDKNSSFRVWLSHTKSSDKSTALIRLWDAVVSEYSMYSIYPGDAFSIHLFLHVLKPFASDARLMHIEFIAFMQHLGNRSSTVKKARIIKIVDAIDNVRQYTSKESYTHLLRELLHYRPIGQERPGYDYDLAILAMRPETYKELSVLSSGIPSHTNGGEEKTVTVLPADFSMLLKHKRNYSDLNRHNKGFTSEMFGFDDLIEDETSNRYDLRFSYYSRFLTSALTSSAPKYTQFSSKEAPASSDSVEYLFYDNLRSLSRNIVRAAQYLDNYRKVINHHSATPEDELKWSRLHSRLLLEGSVLAGSENFPSNFDDELKGRWCPNFFEFTQVEGSSFWGGLVMLRVIQLLEKFPDYYSEDTVVKILTTVIGYPSTSVLSAISVAKEFALIERGKKLLPRITSDVDQSTSQMYTHGLVVTKKGSYVRHLAFTNATVAYLMALTTPLTERKILKHDTQLTWRHYSFSELKSGKTKSRRFHESALRTLVFLIRHLVSQHNMDIAFQPMQLDSMCEHIFDNKASIFALPDLTRIGADCYDLFKWKRDLYLTSKPITNELLDEWNTIINQSS